MARPIVFLSDYGLEDEFVGICHGVIARIAPDSRVIDLAHSVPPGDVVRGAVLLAQSVDYMPEDAVVLAVVDPGVGTNRRAVAVRAVSGRVFVGPDNGLLSLAWERLGGAAEAAEIRSPDVVLEPTSATFHGREVFAPAAAHLSNGRALGGLGPPAEPATLVCVEIAQPRVRDGEVRCEVLAVDRFGNVQLSAGPQHLARAGLRDVDELLVQVDRTETLVRRASTFAELEEGAFGLIVDSRGWLAVVRTAGSAADALAAREGHSVVVTRSRAGVTAPVQGAPTR